MEFESIYALMRSLWLVWLVVLFVGIVAWAYWPKRKHRLEAHGHIPLKDDDQER